MYHSKNISEIIKNLSTDEQIGLLEKEVLKRIDKHGKNIIPKKKRKSIFKIFLEELLSPIELILLITIVISIIIKENTDAIVITFIVLVNLFMGTYQETKALKSAEALSKLLKIKCKVLRDKLTRVGKGTGLLQFENEKDVEEALKMNGQVWQDKTLHIQKSKYIVPV